MGCRLFGVSFRLMTGKNFKFRLDVSLFCHYFPFNISYRGYLADRLLGRTKMHLHLYAKISTQPLHNKTE
jgi:hypothetical protein